MACGRPPWPQGLRKAPWHRFHAHKLHFGCPGTFSNNFWKRYEKYWKNDFWHELWNLCFWWLIATIVILGQGVLENRFVDVLNTMIARSCRRGYVWASVHWYYLYHDPVVLFVPWCCRVYNNNTPLDDLFLLLHVVRHGKTSSHFCYLESVLHPTSDVWFDEWLHYYLFFLVMSFQKFGYEVRYWKQGSFQFPFRFCCQLPFPPSRGGVVPFDETYYRKGSLMIKTGPRPLEPKWLRREYICTCKYKRWIATNESCTPAHLWCNLNS